MFVGQISTNSKQNWPVSLLKKIHFPMSNLSKKWSAPAPSSNFLVLAQKAISLTVLSKPQLHVHNVFISNAMAKISILFTVKKICAIFSTFSFCNLIATKILSNYPEISNNIPYAGIISHKTKPMSSAGQFFTETSVVPLPANMN